MRKKYINNSLNRPGHKGKRSYVYSSKNKTPMGTPTIVHMNPIYQYNMYAGLITDEVPKPS